MRFVHHWFVSVPLRGNGFETEGLTVITNGSAAFPSPCGVMGLKQRRCKNSSTLSLEAVSVPLRGNGFETATI